MRKMIYYYEFILIILVVFFTCLGWCPFAPFESYIGTMLFNQDDPQKDAWKLIHKSLVFLL